MTRRALNSKTVGQLKNELFNLIQRNGTTEVYLLTVLTPKAKDSGGALCVMERDLRNFLEFLPSEDPKLKLESLISAAGKLTRGICTFALIT